VLYDALLIGLAGALGALSRFAVGRLAKSWLGDGFAYGTLTVNVLGCFILALLMQLALHGHGLPTRLQLAVTTGFLGAFTTFSTFGYETLALYSRGQPQLAVLNVVTNITLGLCAAALGWRTALWLK